MAVDTFSAAGRVPAALPLISGSKRNALILIGVLTILRLVTAASLPLAFDEAYYWLWSKNLALGYYDHPPLIAFAIRAGTLLFGDTGFGVRFLPLVLSVAAGWAVWEAAEAILPGKAAGPAACILYNATLMVASQSMAATPDSLVLPAAALLLLAQAKLVETRNGVWWIAAGGALSVAFLAKYTALFLAAGIIVWLALAIEGRVWLKSPWPYLAAAMALCGFAPVLYWNATHNWLSLKFQLGRSVSGGFTLGYAAEFLAAQVALASPFVLFAAGVALFDDARAWPRTKSISIPAAVAWPALAYFAFHSVHDRVQGNWPSFIYPALAVLAVSALLAEEKPSVWAGALRLSRQLAFPAAVLILLVAYVQAFSGVLKLGHKDPIARITAVGFAPVAEEISAVAKRQGDAGIVTTSYAPAGWISFYLAPKLPVLQVTETYRWLATPIASPKLLQSPLLYVSQHPASDLPRARAAFANVRFVKTLTRVRNGAAIDTFTLFSVSGFHGKETPRIANATAP
jgi:4-amino-4-deoxy-L-arabinose transferase-like glycosyltransferase